MYTRLKESLGDGNHQGSANFLYSIPNGNLKGKRRHEGRVGKKWSRKEKAE